jgi:hypothetical protein
MVELFIFFNVVSYGLYLVVILDFMWFKYMNLAWAGTVQRKHDML